MDFDNLQIGDVVCYKKRTSGMLMPQYGTINDIATNAKNKPIFFVIFAKRACPMENGWFFGYQLNKKEGKSAQELSDNYMNAPLPRWV